MEVVLVISAFLIFSILFPPAKKPKSAAHQFGESLEKLLKENCGCDQKKD